MKAILRWGAALVGLLLLASVSSAYVGYSPVFRVPYRQAPDTYNSGFYLMDAWGRLTGPHYYLVPPTGPFNGMLPGPIGNAIMSGYVPHQLLKSKEAMSIGNAPVLGKNPQPGSRGPMPAQYGGAPMPGANMQTPYGYAPTPYGMPPQYGGGQMPYAGGVAPYGGMPPQYQGGPMPFAGMPHQYGGGPMPFGGVAPPYGGGPMPFGGVAPPFGGGPMPFGAGPPPMAGGSPGSGGGFQPFGPAQPFGQFGPTQPFGPMQPFSPTQPFQSFGQFSQFQPMQGPRMDMAPPPSQPMLGGNSFPTHPFTRSPRDFFMWGENLDDERARGNRPFPVP